MPTAALSVHAPESGADPGFLFRGGAKDCACTFTCTLSIIASVKPDVDYGRGPGPGKGPSS